jgi:hypothetical protein
MLFIVCYLTIKFQCQRLAQRFPTYCLCHFLGCFVTIDTHWQNVLLNYYHGINQGIPHTLLLLNYLYQPRKVCVMYMCVRGSILPLCLFHFVYWIFGILVFCILFLVMCLVWPILPVSLDSPVLIPPLVCSNVY